MPTHRIVIEIHLDAHGEGQAGAYTIYCDDRELKTDHRRLRRDTPPAISFDYLATNAIQELELHLCTQVA